MATQTEAACLLESGALYGRRVLLHDPNGDPIFAGFKTGAFSLYFGDAPIVHFDCEGRWQRAYCDDRHYLKGLDTIVQSIDRQREGKNLILKRKTLSPADTASLDERIRAMAIELLSALDADRFETAKPPAKAQPLNALELRAFLKTIAGWDATAWSAHRDAFHSTYGTRMLPFLTPDCPSPVILQATLGHEDDLSFANAPSSPHSVRSPDEFEEHARAVAALLGRRIEQCKSVFLGGSDLMRQPAERLTASLDTIGRVFPRLASNGLHTFQDRFDAPLPDRLALSRFRERGLVRVTLGLESGDSEVLARYRKVWKSEDVRTFVADLKGAGIGVGLMTLVGVGADEERHLEKTADLIGSLDLGVGDLVSIVNASEFANTGGDPRPLDLKGRLETWCSERSVKVVAYSLEKQGLS